MPVDKQHLRATILEQLRATLALQTGAAQLARDEAISEESRAENQYDTHSLEAGYLAEGQARQAAEIEENIAIVASLPLPEFPAGSPVALGAVCDVADESGRIDSYFLCPRAGGLELAVTPRPVLVVTPQSPLGRALLGKRIGDAVQVPGRRPTSPARILAIH
jgi:transcription elongation GreA/GreB family factor